MPHRPPELSEDASGPTPLEGVGVARRGLARLVDLAASQAMVGLGALFAVVLAAAVEAVSGSRTGVALEMLIADEPVGSSRAWQLGVGLAAITVMHSLCEGLHGSTIGKRLCGVTVISEDGGSARTTAGFKRSIGFLVDQMFFGLVGAHLIHNDSKAQRLGDRWAGTMVIRLDALESSARRTTGRFVLASVVGLTAAGAVAFLGFTAQIAHATRATARDGIEVVDVAPTPGQRLRRGTEATFAIRVRHDLHSAYRGNLVLYLPDRGKLVPAPGRTPVRRGGTTTTIEEQVRVPAAPVAPGSYVLSFAVALFPAQNESAFSASGAYDLELIACDWAEPDVLCVMRGRSR